MLSTCFTLNKNCLKKYLFISLSEKKAEICRCIISLNLRLLQGEELNGRKNDHNCTVN